MDLGNHTSAEGSYDGCSTTEILSGLRADVRGREALLVDEWVGIVAWADQNVVTSPEQAATIVEGVIDTGVPIAGEGAPLVSEFNLMELIVVLGRTPDGGRAYVGRVIECAWRLPGVYASVVAGRLAPWRAERIADLTRPLNAEAAGFVDRQLAAVGTVGWAQLERLVNEAVIRFDPERAEAKSDSSRATGPHTDLPRVAWSSRCMSDRVTSCVLVAIGPNSYDVRDQTRKADPPSSAAGRAIATFLQAAKARLTSGVSGIAALAPQPPGGSGGRACRDRAGWAHD